MKSLSASIVTLAGSIVFAAGSLNRHNDTQLFVGALGLALAAVGLVVWARSLRAEP